MENKEINLNYGECIKEQKNIGEIVYHNICTNQTYSVSWGTEAWFWMIVGIILLILLLISCIALFREY